MGVQGASPPAGARGVLATLPSLSAGRRPAKRIMSGSQDKLYAGSRMSVRFLQVPLAGMQGLVSRGDGLKDGRTRAVRVPTSHRRPPFMQKLEHLSLPNHPGRVPDDRW